MDLEFSVIEINFMKRMKNRVIEKDNYFLNLSACGYNYLRMIIETPGRGPL